ncbi:MAG: DUF6431 domain-containing protein [Pseudomonadota bacterium]
MIAEGVLEREEHRRRLCDPDGYRPACCPTCRCPKLHAHDFRERRERGDPERAAEIVRRYLCAGCDAVWMVLPAFLARHLHRSWEIVQSAMAQDGILEASGSEGRVRIPASTRRRWLARLFSSAQVLLHLLADVGAQVSGVIQQLPGECRRLDLVQALVRNGWLQARYQLAELAGWVQRIVPGVRFM